MSWRDTLGVTISETKSLAHNTQNTQKRDQSDNSAYCADSAFTNSVEVNPNLIDVLGRTCQGLTINPAEVHNALSPADIDDWRNGGIDDEMLATLAQMLVERREMDRGHRPACYTRKAVCKHCGPIWLWFSGEVLGCPWCWNRASGKPIPRPDTLSV